VKFFVLQPARRELRDAIEHYEKAKLGLGLEFLQEVRAGVNLILQFPTAWASLSQQIRRYQLKRFPYGLLYDIRDTDILIVAVMHLHREPEYWKDRVSS
jgi:plasmid stabilization system protein ParE